VNGVLLRWRALLWWVLPLAAFVVVLGTEVDWGRRVHVLPDPAGPIEPKVVTAATLPEYQIEGGLAGHAETVARTLFNPTRRPSPVVAADAAKKQLQRGQFVLTGTTIVGDRGIAFVHEVAGNKARSVRKGDQLNGMLVVDVKPDRVRLTLGDEAEELVLKSSPGPRTTIAPPPPVAAQSPNAVPGMPGAQPTPASVAATTLEERRRAARASQAAAPGTVTPGTVLPPAVPAQPGAPQAGAAQAGAPGAPQAVDPAWSEVYRRMQRNQR
jgi:hypothetical protein